MERLLERDVDLREMDRERFLERETDLRVLERDLERLSDLFLRLDLLYDLFLTWLLGDLEIEWFLDDDR